MTCHLVQWFYDDETGDLLPALPESPEAPIERHGENAEIKSAATVERERLDIKAEAEPIRLDVRR